MTFRLLTLALLLATPALAQTPPPPPQSDFLRYIARPEGQEHLDTAVVSYQRGGQTVDLVGAVHIGDLGYYAALNKKLATYDKVLFELVKPEEMDIREMGESHGAVSGLQRWIKDWLGLDFQLDRVNYRAKNFVHADMDSRRLGDKMREHAADIFGALLAWSLGDSARLSHDDGTLRITAWELFVALSDPDRPRALKKLIGRELCEMDISSGDVGGMGFGSVLVADRNQVAIGVLQRVLAGKVKKVAIFYGAAHLPDLHQRMAKLGFARGATQWLTAWDLRQPARAPAK